MTILRAAWLSNIGNVRKENEDRILFNEAARLFGVADGVGGLPGGAEAAQRAADVVTEAVLAAGPEAELDLRAIVTAANDAVALLGQKISPGSGIGTTLTMGCVRHGRMKLAHVGDSRAFLWKHGEITCLTEDHTVENEARRRRARGEVVYYSEAQRGALTRCIGQMLPPEVDVADLPLLAGDRYIFCTDGVTRLVFEREMREIVGRPEDPAVIARNLVELALQRGGPDNATVAALIVDAP
ncbi:MAG TPA: protein phosphatase 2C domain-containing protein [Opitutaceae bacterium]|nr:protein phosphatase 2C domain-containing protein [Opitutaceae bacterium]